MRTRPAKPPASIEGVRVYVVGNPVTTGDGRTWVKLRPYDQDDERRWLFSHDGKLTEGQPE